MSRRAVAGGGSTKDTRGRAVRERLRAAEEADTDTVDPESIDWENVRFEEVDIDPALLERIHARRRLKQITLRVGIEQIAEARRVAERTGLKYQAVLRSWLAEGASQARTRRAHERQRARGARAGASVRN